MLMNNKTKTRLFYSGVLLFILMFIGFARWNRYLLQTDRLQTSGVVYNIRRTGRANMVRIAYRYTVNNSTYKSTTIYSEKKLSRENWGALINKSFPVVYHRKMKFLSVMLISPEDFQEFGVPFPDSLKWVLPLFKE